MKRLSHVLLTALCALTVACLIVAPASAAKDKKADPTTAIKKRLTKADLPAEASAKANKVIDEHAAKLREAQAKVDAVLTKEQQAAKKQAAKDVRTDGKKRKEAAAQIAARLKLTDEQKTKLAAAEKELQAEQAALTKDLSNVLSADELAKAGIKAKKRKNA